MCIQSRMLLIFHLYVLRIVSKYLVLACLLSDIEFTVSDICKLLLNLNCNKSPGPDNIHPRVLKECGDILAVGLPVPPCLLFKSSLQQGLLPQAWKDITPIFKSFSRTDVSNYRPISLISICCKTMEKSVRDSLLRHMINNGFLSDTQHGFVRGRFCTTQLLKVIDKITEMLDEGGYSIPWLFKCLWQGATSATATEASELWCVWISVGLDMKFFYRQDVSKW